MKTYHTLVKIAKKHLEDLQKKRASLERQRQQLLDQKAAYEREIEKEAAVSTDPQLGLRFDVFLKEMRRKIQRTQASINKVQADIDAMAEPIREAFEEFKRKEILRDLRLAELEAAASLRETKQLDELAMQQFSRRRSDEAAS